MATNTPTLAVAAEHLAQALGQCYAGAADGNYTTLLAEDPTALADEFASLHGIAKDVTHLATSHTALLAELAQAALHPCDDARNRATLEVLQNKARTLLHG